MRFDQMIPGGGSNTASEEACAIPSLMGGYTDLLLKHAGAIARALNEQRVAEGRDYIAQGFFTNDNPEGFYVRVTEHMAMWVVPTWGRYDQFEKAEVSFCRSMDPETVAMRPA